MAKYPIQIPYPVDINLHTITERFGEDPDIYGKIIVQGRPLQGHNGSDFAPRDYQFHETWAVDEGKVIEAGQDNTGYGITVLIQHSWGRTRYGHLSQLKVKKGDAVKRNQIIALTGGTGNCIPPGFVHLHFGLYPTGEPVSNGFGGAVDPEEYFDKFSTPVRATPVVTPVTSQPAKTSLRPGRAKVISPVGVRVRTAATTRNPTNVVGILPYGAPVEITGDTVQEGSVTLRKVVAWIAECDGSDVYLQNV